jgi:uncharacterized protein YxeA
MKNILFGITLLIMLTTFSSCITSNKNKNDFNVQYLRTNKHEKRTIVTTVISSKSKLEQYYEDACPNRYYPDENVDYDAKIFRDSIEKYTDGFFTDHYLVIVLLEENSGSIKHEVEKIDEQGNIFIKRILPGDLMTTDMAEWHIVIEINKSFNPEQFTAKITNKD